MNSSDAWAFLVSAIMQNIFIGLWVMTDFWVTAVGKAFFFKSLTVMVLVNSQFASKVWNWPHERLTMNVVHWLIAIGIGVQLVVYLKRRRQTKQEIAWASYGSD